MMNYPEPLPKPEFHLGLWGWAALILAIFIIPIAILTIIKLEELGIIP